MEEDIREAMAKLDGRMKECETAAGRNALVKELLDRGAPLVPHLLEIAAEKGELSYRHKKWLDRIDGADQVLLDIRENGPGRLRRYALQGLAEIGAAHLLSDRDRGAIERLFRLRSLEKSPRSPEYWPESWLTVRGDLDTIVETLGLHHLHRVPVNTGVHAAVMEEHSGRFTGAAGAAVSADRVFVSPEVEGWRVVFLGYACLSLLIDWALALSRTCGEAQSFYNDDYDSDDSFWCIARDGAYHRAYFPNSDPSWYGDPLPFEEDEDDLTPNIVAIEMSIMPDDVVAAEDVTDGWLATTHPEVTPWHFKGALPL